MKNFIIALMLSLAFLSCEKEEIDIEEEIEEINIIDTILDREELLGKQFISIDSMIYIDTINHVWPRNEQTIVFLRAHNTEQEAIWKSQVIIMSDSTWKRINQWYSIWNLEDGKLNAYDGLLNIVYQRIGIDGNTTSDSTFGPQPILMDSWEFDFEYVEDTRPDPWHEGRPDKLIIFLDNTKFFEPY